MTRIISDKRRYSVPAASFNVLGYLISLPPLPPQRCHGSRHPLVVFVVKIDDEAGVCSATW